MKKRGIKIIISAILFVLALVIPFSNEWINNGLFIISYLVVGFEILKKAVRNIFRGKVFDENFLMAVATIGAFAIGEFPEAVAVMLFYQVGELFQSYAVDKSRKSIASLMDIRPDYANIEKDGKVEKINQTHSPDCSGYPTTSAGKSLGVRSNSGKQEIASKKTILPRYFLSKHH